MAFQTGKNVVVAYKVQPTKGTPPGTGSAKQLRITPGPGLGLKRATIRSNEIRSDGLTSQGRLGSRMVDGSYSIELSVGSFDDLLEALMRSTWVAATAITVDNTAANVSFQVTGTSTVAYVGTTNLLTKGLRVGDVARFTNMSTAANNNINLRIKTVAADGLSFTVQGTPLTIQAADSAATLTILKKLKNGTTPTKRAFYFEQYYAETGVDLSQVFDYCRVIGLKINGTPDGMATAELTVLGTDMSTLASGASPYFITPTLSTTVALAFADAVLNYGGTDVAIATAFELNIQITAKTEPVISSPGSPDVFDNDTQLSGSLTFIRQDLANVAAFVAETEFELHLLLTEPEAEPKDCISIYVPRIKLTDAAAPLGGDGAMIETLPFMVGKKEGASATGYDDTMLTICTSAP